MPACLVGTCGWSEAHARQVVDFPVIEIQNTFYEPPSAALAAKWRASAPLGFQFCIKAWQLITHTPASPTYRRLKSPIAANERDLFGSFRPTEQVWLAWERTLEIAKVLEATVIVFQCPASFLPSAENVSNLERFFARVERTSCSLAWEPRGEWPPALIRALCSTHRLIHCVDPFTNDPLFGDQLYWRLHGKGGYSYRYTAPDLDQLQRQFSFHSKETHGPNYVLFNNLAMKDDALRFQALFQGQTPQ